MRHYWGKNITITQLCSLDLQLDFYLLLFFFFGCALATCGILIPRPEIEPRPSAVRVQSPNHWTAKEFPNLYLFPEKQYGWWLREGLWSPSLLSQGQSWFCHWAAVSLITLINCLLPQFPHLLNGVNCSTYPIV